MFQLMSTATLAIANSPKQMTQEELALEISMLDYVSNIIMYTGASVIDIRLEGNPFITGFLDWTRAKTTPFPSVLIKQAEDNGNLYEVVKKYKLKPKSSLSPGRPVSRIPLRTPTGDIRYPAGVYYNFSDDAGKRRYIADRVIGLTALAEAYTHIGGNVGAITRGAKENLKAEMFSYQDPKMETRTGMERIPTESVYLKTANQQDLDMNTHLMYALYQLGILTPLKASKREVIMERSFENTIKQIKDLRDPSQF